MNIAENNRVGIIGEVISGFEFSHEVFGESFYRVMVSVKRKSDCPDIVPVMVSERLMDVTISRKGETVSVTGQFRSYNRQSGIKNHLELNLFAQDWEVLWGDIGYGHSNQIYLNGFICKPPIYRKTPRGMEIADLLIAVNRSYGKSDYIPCVAWGRNARYSATLDVGTKLKIWGRVQSREYVKKIGENEEEKRVAYEVSIGSMELVCL